MMKKEELQALMKLQVFRQITGLTVVVMVATGLTVKCFYIDNLNEEANWRNQTIMLKQKVAAIRKAQQCHGDLTKYEALLKKQEKELAASHLSDMEAASIPGRLLDKADKSQVRLFDMEPQSNTDEFYAYRITIRGSYENIMEFVKQLENMMPFTIINEIKITPEHIELENGLDAQMLLHIGRRL